MVPRFLDSAPFSAPLIDAVPRKRDFDPVVAGKYKDSDENIGDQFSENGESVRASAFGQGGTISDRSSDVASRRTRVCVRTRSEASVVRNALDSDL